MKNYWEEVEGGGGDCDCDKVYSFECVYPFSIFENFNEPRQYLIACFGMVYLDILSKLAKLLYI